ncbi:MAG: hypothetical protein ACXW2T_05850 [Allosphingosinicella sp.]
MTEPPQMTPDGRYIIVRGRLWRAANPDLAPKEQQRLVDQLMDSRRSVRSALKSGDEAALQSARASVQKAKEGLGERGPVWWTDGSPDLDRRMVLNTCYAGWCQELMDRELR